MRVNPAIFRAYDIRGQYPDDISDELARNLGSRLAAYLRSRRFIVGRDERPGSEALAHAAMEGATAGGSNVVDIGVVSTPQFQWAVRSLQADGGMMVTASHLPQSQNGFKAIARRGDVLEVIGGDRLRQILDSGSSEASGGLISQEDVVEGYAAAVAYAAGWKGGKELLLSVDAPAAVQRVLERLGTIAPDDALAIRCDADGDRITFFAHGNELPAEAIFLLLADQLKISPLVFDLRFSRAVREHLDRMGTPYAVSRVGRLYLSLAMRERGAVLGAEMSGHFYWQAMGGLESPELTLLRVLQACNSNADRLESLLRQYHLYAKSPEISIPIRDMKHAHAVMGMLEKRYMGCGIDRQDGVTVDCWNGYLSVPAEEGFWFNVRQSQTEPVLRLVVESKRKALLERRLQEVRGLISEGL